MIIKLLVDGGEMKPGPTVAQKIGPMGINMGQVISSVNEATAQFKGTKVPVALDVDPKTKLFKIEVFSPPTSGLLKKELALEKGAGDHKKEKMANASIEQIIKIAKIKHPSMLAREFKSAVKSVVGSCASLGILIENKEAVALEEDIQNGMFDTEINEQRTETSAEKKQKLQEFYTELLRKQEEARKAEEAAKAAAEAAAAEAKPAEGAEAGEAAKEGEGEAAKGAPAAKKEEGKAEVKSAEKIAAKPAAKPAAKGKPEKAK